MYKEAPEIVRTFLSYKLSIQNRSPLTVKEYWLDLRMFFRYIYASRGYTPANNFENIDISSLDAEIVSSVTTEEIYDFLLWLSEKDVKAVSRSRKLSSVRAFFKYHRHKSLQIKNDPSEHIDSPSVKRKLPKVLSLKEANLLLDSVDKTDNNAKRDFCIMTLFLNCGMRLSELVGINISDISEDGRKLTVTGKGNKQRTIYLNNACRSSINDYLSTRDYYAKLRHAVIKDKNALFLSSRYQRIANKTVQWVVEKHLKKAGLDGRGYSVHKLRHTAATLMYEQGGVDVRVIKEILGHEQLNTTQIYTHVSDRQIEQAMDKNPLADRKDR